MNFEKLEPVYLSAAATLESVVPAGEGGLKTRGGRKPEDKKKSHLFAYDNVTFMAFI